MPYTIREQMLSDEDLIECYRESIRYGCDAGFIAILRHSIAARGLAMREEEGGELRPVKHNAASSEH